MLHFCELPFRALVRALDGATSGPFTLKGPIGSTLNEDLTELEVAEFKKIPNPDFHIVAEEDGYELSKDQAFLDQMCHAIMEGELPTSLANQDPGKLSHARWFFVEIRLYYSSIKPLPKHCSCNHQLLSSILVPNQDSPKKHRWPKKPHGNGQVFKKTWEVVHKVLQRNGYFAHPEAILLSMLADENTDLRALAVNQILTIRIKAQEQSQASNQQEDDGRGVDDLDDDNELAEENDDRLQMDPSEKAAISNSKIRQYIILNINFAALTYPELIDWEISKLSEPPLTLSLTNSDLMAIKESPLSMPHC